MYESENTFELYPEPTGFENEHFEFAQSECGFEVSLTSSHQHF